VARARATNILVRLLFFFGSLGSFHAVFFPFSLFYFFLPPSRLFFQLKQAREKKREKEEKKANQPDSSGMKEKKQMHA
jgi:hypothetical protein